MFDNEGKNLQKSIFEHLTLFFQMFPFDPNVIRGIKREHWEEKG